MRTDRSLTTRFFFLLLASILASLFLGGYFTYYSFEKASQLQKQVGITETMLQERTLWELAKLGEMQAEILAKEQEMLQLMNRMEVTLGEIRAGIPPAKPGEKTYTAVTLYLLPGDNIWKLVSRFVKSPSPELINEILAINNISDPKKLSPGASIALPLEKIGGHSTLYLNK